MLIQAPTRIYRSWVADSRRWDAYRPRAGDIVISTYPKSGTTWMQQIIGLLVFQSDEPRPVTEIGDWLERRSAPGDTLEQLMAMFEAQTHRRFIKSHLPLDGLPFYDEVKYIHVARDGRDACLSYHNHCSGFSDHQHAALDANGLGDETIARTYPRATADAAEFFRRWMSEGLGGAQDGMPFLSWFDFERTFWAKRHEPNVLLVHYRDLKADLDGEMRRISSFLGIETPEALWPKLVKAATFAEMRRKGDQIAPKMMQRFQGGAERFFHKGENERWHGVLTDADIAAYEAKVRERLEPDCAAWLRSGRLASNTKL
ncbi:MAG: sulfotransferase domain-containing protein [Hyphomicrobiaceae bacterium]